MKFDPSKLTTRSLDGNGMLHKNFLFFGCDVPTCRTSSKRRGSLNITPASKYPIRQLVGRHATGANGLPRLVSLSTLVDSHRLRKHGLTNDVHAVTGFAKAFMLGAGAAQMANTVEAASGETPRRVKPRKAEMPEAETPKETPSKAEKNESAREEEEHESDPCVLRMPPDTPAKDSYEENRQVREALCPPSPPVCISYLTLPSTRPSPPTSHMLHLLTMCTTVSGRRGST